MQVVFLFGKELVGGVTVVQDRRDRRQRAGRLALIPLEAAAGSGTDRHSALRILRLALGQAEGRGGNTTQETRPQRLVRLGNIKRGDN